MGMDRSNRVFGWLLASGVALATARAAIADDQSLAGKVRNFFGRGKTERVQGGASRVEGQNAEPNRRQTRSIQQVSATDVEHEPLTREHRHSAASSPQPSILNSQPSKAELEIQYFENLALANNPTLQQAQATINAAIGRQIQAGFYPNPTFGYTGSEIGNDGRGGQQGIVFSQEIVRGNKLCLSSLVAGFSREQAEAQAAAQLWRVRNTIRSLYFETLAAQETKRFSDELVSLAEKGVSVAQQREKAGEGTLTETLQAQIELEQVRILAANSANNLRGSWKRLVAVVGRPEMEPELLEGALEAGPAERDEVSALAALAAQSPEVRIAEAGIRRAEAAVDRARVEPIPNVTIEAGTQYDYGSRTQIANVGVSFPLPIRNRNQGNVMAAESELTRAQREADRVKLSLAERFAAEFARYRNALEQVARYGTRLPDDEVMRILTLMGDERKQALDAHPQILPRAQIALALATEGWQRGEFSYLHVLTAQRTLSQVSLSYVRSLADLRQSTVAIDGYLLSDGLSEGGSSAAAASGGVSD
jgi:cobalt-zinc-cadmium efflux system outer membrane protein